jgi:hypothetical protein
MDLLAKIGAMAGEDVLGGGGDAAKRFGYADLDSAEKALKAMEGDAETAKKIRAKDPVVYARYKGLVSAVAHFREKAPAPLNRRPCYTAIDRGRKSRDFRPLRSFSWGGRTDRPRRLI